MLRKIRIAAALTLLVLITFYFVDFAGLLPKEVRVLARIQFIPAVIFHSIALILAILALTALLGRLYCSVVCPMGVLQDVVARTAGFFRKKKKRYRYSPARNGLRYPFLVVMIVAMAAGGMTLVGLLDPYSAYGRIATHLFRPTYLAGNNLLEQVFTSFGNYTFYRMGIYIQHYFSLVVAAATLLLVGVLAWKHGRAYCNTVCPVGTFLGLLSRYSLLKVRVNNGKCNDCGLCSMHCKSSCIDSKNNRIDHSRCVVCFDCLDVCRRGALAFSFANPRPRESVRADPSRRKFIATLTATPLLLGWGQRRRSEKPENLSGRQIPLSPPGSLAHSYLNRHCTACHLCVSRCPSRILKPAFMEYGLSGMMQPVMYFERGFCNFDCTVCGEVCPNGAIRALTMEEKHLTQVGKVVFVESDCIVPRDGTSCGACSEHCPTQAVSMVPYRSGLTIPQINTAICVGCGGCEYICPARPRKAIYVEGNVVHEQALPFVDAQAHEGEIDGFGF